MKEREIIFHIGLHKTGSTFLQKNIFPYLDNVEYLGSMKNLSVINLPTLINSKNNLLISNEGLSGFGYLGKEESWLNQFKTSIDAIKSICPKAKIMIGFREHTEIIVSMYNQYLKEGGKKKFNEFLELNYKSLIEGDGASFLKRINYIESRFENEPFIYTQNNLKNNFSQFINKLENFTNGVYKNKNLYKESNKSIGNFQAEVLRNINKYSYSEFNPNGLIKWRFKPVRYLRLNPRAFCEKWLSIIPSKPMQIDKSLISQIQLQYKEDWKATCEIEKANSEKLLNK